jgi:hydroxyacylglutathione hydrolase
MIQYTGPATVFLKMMSYISLTTPGLSMQITPHIHIMTTALGPSPDHFVNAYLVDGNNLTLIDTGFNVSGTLITDTVLALGRDPSEISLIVLTHHHPDHVGSAGAIQNRTGCDIAAHAKEIPAIENLGPALMKPPGPGLPALVSGPVRVTRPLEDGDTLEIDAGMTLRVLHTPGHTPGSIALFAQEENALFSGDAVSVPGRVPIYSDPKVYVRSLQRLRGISAMRHFLPGHDTPAEDKACYERIDDALAYVRHIDDVVRKVSEKAEPGVDPEALTREVLAVLGIGQPHIAHMAVQTIMGHVQARGFDDALKDRR